MTMKLHSSHKPIVKIVSIIISPINTSAMNLPAIMTIATTTATKARNNHKTRKNRKT